MSSSTNQRGYDPKLLDELLSEIPKPDPSGIFAIDASRVILGFTGPIGSGCTYVSQNLYKMIKDRYEYYKLSDIFRDLLKKKGITDPPVQLLQDVGNALRTKFGDGILIWLLFTKLTQKKRRHRNEDSNIIIDGIKNVGEVNTLKRFPYF